MFSLPVECVEGMNWQGDAHSFGDSHGDSKLLTFGEHLFLSRSAQGVALGDCGVTCWIKIGIDNGPGRFQHVDEV